MLTTKTYLMWIKWTAPNKHSINISSSHIRVRTFVAYMCTIYCVYIYIYDTCVHTFVLYIYDMCGACACSIVKRSKKPLTIAPVIIFYLNNLDNFRFHCFHFIAYIYYSQQRICRDKYLRDIQTHTDTHITMQHHQQVTFFNKNKVKSEKKKEKEPVQTIRRI